MKYSQGFHSILYEIAIVVLWWKIYTIDLVEKINSQAV